MKRKHTTRSALFTSIISLLLCVSMLVGTTFAWFTDSVTSGKNQIIAGNLDVVLEYKTDWEDEWEEVTSDTKIFKEGVCYEPGYTEVVFLRIRNAGSLALNYNLYVEVSNEKGSTNVYGESFKLSEHLWVGTYLQDEYVGAFNYADILLPTMFSDRENSLGNVENLSRLSEMNSLVASRSPLLPGETTSQVMAIVLTMPEIVGNEANHKTGVAAPQLDLGVKLVAIQYNYEEDSFGSDYDESLDPEYKYVSNPAELKNAMLIKGAKIKLMNDIVINAGTPLQWGSYMFVANGREVTIDLNGHDIVVEEDAFKRANAVFTTANGGTLNIVGEGTVEVKNGQSGIFHAMNKNDRINVYGGTFISNSNNGSNGLAIMYTNSGSVDVYGGKFVSPAGVEHANVEDKQGNRLSIQFHEGTLLNHSKYYDGTDAIRIQLEEGCYLKQVEIDGETWYQVAKKQEDVHYISNTDDMREAMKVSGAKIVLTKDVVINDDKGTGYALYAKYDMTIDLNGYDIKVDMPGKEFYGVVYALNGAKVDILGEGNVEVNGGVGNLVWCTGGNQNNPNGTTINIYGGNWILNSEDFTEKNDNYVEGVYANNGGVVNIYGGMFDWGNFSAYTVNESRNGVVTICGGTFVNFDPQASHDNDGSYTAAGYAVVSETQANGDIWYTVVPVA